ncbi:MAG: hypothetical protein WCZ66_02520 [Sphingomonadaceae bacterium]
MSNCYKYSLLVLALVAAPVVAGPFDASSIVDESVLAQTTGRANLLQITEGIQAAAVSESSVSGNSVTGNVRILDNAFQNMSGLAIISSNTGNNVAMNASIQVNVALSPNP